jgi:hypothetical protein
MYATLRAGSRVLAAAALLITPTALDAQALPPAAEILAAYTKAVGGADAWSKIQGMQASGTYAVPSMGMSAEFATWAARPNRMLMVINIPGMGEMRQGYDGTTAWAIDPMQGARVLDAGELKATMDQADFDSGMRLMSSYTSAETVEKTTMGGQECYKVKLVTKSGRETYDCFSTKDGLLVGSSSMQESPMGSVEAVTIVSDWKDFGGFKMPTKSQISAMGMEQVLVINNVEYVTVDAAKFELPAEIKALVKK